MPEITLSIYFFPDWEHFSCLPLDGYTESSFAGSRGRQPLTSAGNLLGIFFLSFLLFSDSVSDYVMQLSFPSLKLLFSGGWKKSLPWRNLQQIKQDDPFDPDFIQCHFACRDHAQIVRPHQQIEGIS